MGHCARLRLIRVLILPLVAGLVLVLASSIPASAQNIQWVRQFGSNPEQRRDDFANGIALAEGNVYVVGDTIGIFPGQSQTALNDRDAFVTRFDTNGNQTWTWQFGATSVAVDVATAAAADGSGVYVVGWTKGAFPLQNQLGGNDAFIRKYDAEGLELWTRQFGTLADDEALGVAANASGVYVVGVVHCCGAVLTPGLPVGGSTDAFIRKYDGNGNEQWTRQFGSADAEEGRGVALDETGVYVVGITTGAFPGPASGTDGFIRKYDLEGNVLWTRQFGGVLPNGDATNDDAFAIAVGSGGVYVSGAIASGAFPTQTFSGGLWDAYVVKYDPDGNPQWVRQFGTDGDDYGYAIALGATTVMVGGGTGGAFPGQTYTSNGDAFVRLLDPDGNHLGTIEYGSSGGSLDDVRAATADLSGFYLAGAKGGNALDQTPLGGEDGYAMKILPPPIVPERAVVNGASFTTNPPGLPAPPLAPGSIAVIFGSYLNDGSNTLSTSFGPNGKLVTELAGTEVRVNNVLAPLFYSTPGQVAIQIPFEVAGETTASLVVTVAGQSSTPRTINIAPTAPGFFTLNQAGSGQAVALHSDGVTPVTDSNPARRNEVVIFYLTGLGALTSPLETGAPASASPSAAAATLTFGGIAASGIAAVIDYAGTAPGFVGLNQVNAHIPSDAPIGADISVALSIGGRLSNQVTIPIGE